MLVAKVEAVTQRVEGHAFEEAAVPELPKVSA